MPGPHPVELAWQDGDPRSPTYLDKHVLALRTFAEPELRTGSEWYLWAQAEFTKQEATRPGPRWHPTVTLLDPAET